MQALSRLDPWLPPLLLMGLIWLLSAQPDLTTGLGLIDLIARKVVHALAFGLLLWLWWRALREPLGPGGGLALAAAVTLLYAALDEYHQSFVAGRNGSALDVAIDAAGAAIAAILASRATARGEPG